MNRIMALVVCLSAAVPSSAFASCVQPTSTTGRGEGASGSVQTTATTSGPNYGFYRWSEASQAWLLVEQAWIPEAESQTLEEGDYYFPPSVYGGGGGGGGELPTQPLGGKAPGFSISSDCEPDELPTVVVTATRPSTSGTIPYIMLMYRPPQFRSGGGGVGKPRKGGVRQADSNLTCAASLEELKLAALAPGVLPRFPNMPSNSVWLVRYAPGHSQRWLVGSSMASDLQLQPLGSCVSK